jgi:glycine dehydrogenase
VFNTGDAPTSRSTQVADDVDARFDERFARTSPYPHAPGLLALPQRDRDAALHARLQAKDFSLVHGMIPLGSCTMKLNATAEMIPVTWPEFGKLHPFAPVSRRRAMPPCSRSSSATRRDHRLRGRVAAAERRARRASTRGCSSFAPITSRVAKHIARLPHSAVGARHQPGQRGDGGHARGGGEDRRERQHRRGRPAAKAEQHSHELAALMVTYPSTHGVFETRIKDICAIVHEHGGQVYMDGANMNAMVGVSRPGDSAPTCATSTCTRRSAFRTAAAARAWAPSAWRRSSRRSCRAIR